MTDSLLQTVRVAMLFLVTFLILIFHPVLAADFPHGACEMQKNPAMDAYRFWADLDGVDGPETYVADRSDQSTVLTSCDDESIGPWDMEDTNKPLSKIVVLDIEQDGIDELLVGGPTGYGPFTGNVARLVGTRLEYGQSVTLRPADTEVGSIGFDGHTFACVETVVGEPRKLVNYTYTENSNELVWQGSDGSAGIFKLPAQSTEAWLFRSGQCGNQLASNSGFHFYGFPQAGIPHLATGSTVQLGINNKILLSRSAEELKEPANWVIPVNMYAGYSGPFDVLSALARDLNIHIGEHDHCAGSPLPPPDFKETDLIQVSLQTVWIDSCLQWSAVDFWMRPDFTIAAIILNIWEP